MQGVLILSGGLDSTTALYQLRAQKREVCCLTFDYGQRHAIEWSRARGICRTLGVEWHLVKLEALTSLLDQSALTNPSIPVPEGRYTDESMRATVVPNRNMILLSIAIGHAINVGADSVIIGAHGGDHRTYPDCRPTFLKIMRRAALVCDWHPVKLEVPFLGMTKADIVRIGASLDVPFYQTWSCYAPVQPTKVDDLHMHCGVCGACVDRKEAFRLAGVADSTCYHKR